MSVDTTTRKASFTLDGTTDTFDFTFRALSATDIKCVSTTNSTDTILTYTTNYTVALNSDGVGGTVTLVSAPSTGTGTLTVYRETTDTQESDYEDYNQFPADTLEEDLDRRTLISQELDETIDRTVTLGISSPSVTSTALPTPTADRYIGWDSAGTALENKNISSLGAITTDTDGTLTANSDSKVATQKATKTYVDTKASKGANTDITSLAGLTTPLSEAQGGTGATSIPANFVDRGDPAADDFSSFTADAAWHDLDLSAIVPAGAIAVLIRASILDDATNTLFMFRENGNSNEYNVAEVRSQAANVTMANTLVVPCSTARVIEYYITNTTITGTAVTVMGWFK